MRRAAACGRQRVGRRGSVEALGGAATTQKTTVTAPPPAPPWSVGARGSCQSESASATRDGDRESADVERGPAPPRTDVDEVHDAQRAANPSTRFPAARRTPARARAAEPVAGARRAHHRASTTERRPRGRRRPNASSHPHRARRRRPGCTRGAAARTRRSERAACAARASPRAISLVMTSETTTADRGAQNVSAQRAFHLPPSL